MPLSLPKTKHVCVCNFAASYGPAQYGVANKSGVYLSTAFNVCICNVDKLLISC